MSSDNSKINSEPRRSIATDDPKGIMDMFNGMALRKAADGSRKQARNNLNSIAECLETNTLTGPMKDWLILALKEIAAGADPAKTLFLKGRQGKNPEKEELIWHRNRAIYFYLQEVKKNSPNINKNEAYLDLYERFNSIRLGKNGVDPHAAREILGLSSFSDDEISTMFHQGLSEDVCRDAYEQFAKKNKDNFQAHVYDGETLIFAGYDHRPLF